MHNKTLEKYENKIKQIKEQILETGDMRPGSLTQQVFKRGDYTRPYWQISYTQNKKSKTEYVREDSVKVLQQEIAEYHTFKKLTAEWIELAIKISKEKIKMKNKSNPS
jgi:hypothetical protein